MEGLFSGPAWLEAAIVFSLRLGDMSLDTLRTLFVLRGRKAIAWMLGLIQSLIFIAAIAFVLKATDNPLSMIGYAAGFATGTVVGMILEARLAIGHVHLSLVSSRWGSAIAERIRAEGYAVTEIPARGKDGTVSLLNCGVQRKDLERVTRAARAVDPDVFITAEDLRPLRRGFWRA